MQPPIALLLFFLSLDQAVSLSPSKMIRKQESNADAQSRHAMAINSRSELSAFNTKNAHDAEQPGAFDARSPRRFAIALYGGVTNLNGQFHEGTSGSKMDVNISLPASMLWHNLIGPTGPADVFIHSWNPSLEKAMMQLYRPTAALFENNEPYVSEFNGITNHAPHGSMWIQVSMAFSMSKVLKLVMDYSSNTTHTYDYVYLGRPDVLLRKQIDLKMVAPADVHEIPHTQGNDGHADFHFLISGRNVDSFSKLYESIPALHTPVAPHSGWIQESLAQHGLKTVEDGTIAGLDEEVYRKLPEGRSAEKQTKWRASLAPFMPPDCIEDLMTHSESHPVRAKCFISVPQ